MGVEEMGDQHPSPESISLRQQELVRSAVVFNFLLRKALPSISRKRVSSFAFSEIQDPKEMSVVVNPTLLRTECGLNKIQGLPGERTIITDFNQLRVCDLLIIWQKASAV